LRLTAPATWNRLASSRVARVNRVFSAPPMVVDVETNSIRGIIMGTPYLIILHSVRKALN